MKEGKMIIVTKHAVDRCVERLLKINNPTLSDYHFARYFIEAIVEPSGANFLDGAKYYAQIEGYSDYRAVFKVENGFHVLKTITPII